MGYVHEPEGAWLQRSLHGQSPSLPTTSSSSHNTWKFGVLQDKLALHPKRDILALPVWIDGYFHGYNTDAPTSSCHGNDCYPAHSMFSGYDAWKPVKCGTGCRRFLRGSDTESHQNTHYVTHCMLHVENLRTEFCGHLPLHGLESRGGEDPQVTTRS